MATFYSYFDITRGYMICRVKVSVDADDETTGLAVHNLRASSSSKLQSSFANHLLSKLFLKFPTVIIYYIITLYIITCISFLKSPFYIIIKRPLRRKITPWPRKKCRDRRDSSWLTFPMLSCFWRPSFRGHLLSGQHLHTLWLCQNSYWKWQFSLNIVIFHSYVSLPEGNYGKIHHF